MKPLVVLLMIVLLVFSMALPALAVEDAPFPTEDPANDLTQLPEDTSPDTSEDSPPGPEEYYTYELPEAITGDGSALHDAIISIFGRYTPKTQTVTRHLSDGTDVTYTEYVPGVAGMNFEWLFSAAVFALVVFCVLKLFGGLLKL